MWLSLLDDSSASSTNRQRRFNFFARVRWRHARSTGDSSLLSSLRMKQRRKKVYRTPFCSNATLMFLGKWKMSRICGGRRRHNIWSQGQNAADLLRDAICQCNSRARGRNNSATYGAASKGHFRHRLQSRADFWKSGGCDINISSQD